MMPVAPRIVNNLAVVLVVSGCPGALGESY